MSKTAFVGLLVVVAVISALVTALAMPSPSTTATAAATPICSQTRETTFADGSPFFDYTHKETGAKILKAQHPEFELWSQGIYARQGQVAAIDWRKNGGEIRYAGISISRSTRSPPPQRLLSPARRARRAPR